MFVSAADSIEVLAIHILTCPAHVFWDCFLGGLLLMTSGGFPAFGCATLGGVACFC